MKEAGSSDRRVLPCGLSAGSWVPHAGSYATWSGKACKTAAVRLVTCSLLKMFSRWVRTHSSASLTVIAALMASRYAKPLRPGHT